MREQFAPFWEKLNHFLKIVPRLIKRYPLFLLILMTFLIEAWIFIVIFRMPSDQTIVQLIIENTTKLSILMLLTAFFYLFIDALFYLEDQRSYEESHVEPNKREEERDFAGILTRLLIGSLGAKY